MLIFYRGFFIMKLVDYAKGLLSNLKDSRVVRTAKNMIEKIVDNKSIQIYANSSDKAEYKREKRLLDGSLNSVLKDSKIRDALMENSVASFKGENYLYLLHDPCDIRKEYSEKLENLGKVKALDGKIVNGYSTFNTVIVNEKAQKLRLHSTEFYSNREERYVTQEELDKYKKLLKDKEVTNERNIEIKKHVEENSYINLQKITLNSIKRSSEFLKVQNPDVVLCNVLDRGFDGDKYFEFINEDLSDKFVIRLKMNRNSDKLDDKGKSIKLEELNLENSTEIILKKVMIRKKVRYDVKCLICWGKCRINGKEYMLVRVMLFDSKGNRIFKNPLMLLTNLEAINFEEAYHIYKIYLMRAKIEGVFKFLKEVLGWEEFQQRDFESIKNLVTLCYFIGGYFYEIEDVLVRNSTIKMIAELGNSKGKVSRYYILKGLEKLLIAQEVERFRKDNEISDEDFMEMMSYATL